MKAFSRYARHLERLIEVGGKASLSDWASARAAALNGEPSRELRQAIGLAERRAAGAFFTGSRLAQYAVIGGVDSETTPSVFFDPACGAGDLLLAAARFLPLRQSLPETVKYWGMRLAGCDIHAEFVRAAKARLAILAVERGAFSGFDVIDPRNLFPLLRTGNALTEDRGYLCSNWILLNPPYVAAEAPSSCTWSSGRVSSAALFVETALLRCKPGARITAIVPDVLRTGTRYAKWRSFVASHAEQVSIKSWGLFDTAADVDVFVMTIVKRRRPIDGTHFRWVPNPPRTMRKVGDLFDVRIGPVVPFRLKDGVGDETAFVHAKALPRWKRVSKIADKCRFGGTLYAPPFVVVRRTSRPGDPHRAVATLITASQRVAVENHLLVCLPRSGTIKDCLELIRRLKRKKTSQFLNERIRCRHLTVSAIRDLPWWKE